MHACNSTPSVENFEPTRVTTVPVLGTTLVFDQVLEGATVAYSDPQWAPQLTDPDALTIGFIADNCSGTSVALTISLETSPNKVDWVGSFKDEGLIIYNEPSTTSVTTAEVTVTQEAFYQRLRVNLSGNSPRARVRIFAFGRESC